MTTRVPESSSLVIPLDPLKALSATWTREAAIEWLKALGFVPSGHNEAWEIAWSDRAGLESTTLIFYPLYRHEHDVGWDAAVGHHASGTNPQLTVGRCETRADMEMIYETLRLLNGYKKPEDHRCADELDALLAVSSQRTEEKEDTRID